MKWDLTSFKIVFLIGVALFALDRIALWMEGRGWLYWRHRKSSSGGLGPALQELNSFLNPSVKHVIQQQKQEKVKKRGEQSDSSK